MLAIFSAEITEPSAEFSLTPNLDCFTPFFFTLTPTCSKAPLEKYGKTPNFTDKQHFYSYFQNPIEQTCTIGGQAKNQTYRNKRGSHVFFLIFFLVGVTCN